MTMRPAPTGHFGRRNCSLDCRTAEAFNGEWSAIVDGIVWKNGLPETGKVRVEQIPLCPVCGRPLGFDTDGNPVVGYSPAQIEQAGKQLAFRLVRVAKGGQHLSACANQTCDDVWQDELAATEEASDDRNPDA